MLLANRFVQGRSLIFIARRGLSQGTWPAESKTGLKHRDDKDGAGEIKADIGDTVSVHYSGYLAENSKLFDSSYNRGQPISFQLGANRVIPGWEEGICGMKVGGKRTLLIPPHLGYGYADNGPIPSGSTLLFECELVGLEKYVSIIDRIKNIFKK